MHLCNSISTHYISIYLLNLSIYIAIFLSIYTIIHVSIFTLMPSMCLEADLPSKASLDCTSAPSFNLNANLSYEMQWIGPLHPFLHVCSTFRGSLSDTGLIDLVRFFFKDFKNTVNSFDTFWRVKAHFLEHPMLSKKPLVTKKLREETE